MTEKTIVKRRHGPPARGESGLRPELKWGALTVVLLCCGALLWHFRGQGPPSSTPVAVAEPETTSPEPNRLHRPAAPATSPAGAVAPTASAGASAAVSTPIAAQPAPIPVSLPPLGPVDPAIGALATGLKYLGGTNTVSEASVAAWQTNFAKLLQNGAAAVPALRAFLADKTDYAFNQQAWQATGYPSARVAAIDALRQIGGPEAIAAMQELLSTTQSPRDIAVLARNLDGADPGQYREQALAAARNALQAAASGNSAVDVAPLFEVFQQYGDASTIPDLEKAMGQWRYYATIALANLPDGAGVPSLLRMAEPGTSSGNRLIALEMVAQLAGNNPAARDFLLAQAGANNIGAAVWPYLASPLAGDQYFPVDSAITLYPQLQSWSDLKTTTISAGNQKLYLLPGYQSLSADALNARLDLVDQLLRTATDPAAITALQQARQTLTQRSTRATAQTQPGATAAAGP